MSEKTVHLTVTWAKHDLSAIRQAASLLGMSAEELVQKAAVVEAERVLKQRKGMMDLASASQYLGVSRNDIIDLISTGRLKAQKIDAEWMIEEASAREVFKREGADQTDHIELDLRALVEETGLAGLEIDGHAPDSVSATWCYVSQHGILICPKSAWRRFDRERIVGEARDAARRYLKRSK